MRWFKEAAPVRLKLLVAFGMLWSLTALVAVAPVLFGGAAVWIIGAGATVISGIACIAFREAIAGPYVATVVRMEALAAGDLTSPIEFTGYSDCVGRLTKAMFTFKEAAATQIAQNAEAERNSNIVRTMSNNMEKLADGDLTADITADFPASYAALKASFNQALSNLRDVIGGVSKGTEAIRTGSSEIAQASEDLARRTESNAASLEETSAALVQIEGRLKASATAAQGTVARADRAIASVGSGRKTAETATAAMTRVSDSAKGIDDVIEGLDKIAFQTRVLASHHLSPFGSFPPRRFARKPTERFRGGKRPDRCRPIADAVGGSASPDRGHSIARRQGVSSRLLVRSSDTELFNGFPRWRGNGDLKWNA